MKNLCSFQRRRILFDIFESYIKFISMQEVTNFKTLAESDQNPYEGKKINI